MLDIKFILENEKLVQQATRNKQVDVSIDKLIMLYKKRNLIQVALDTLRSQSNELNNQIKDASETNKKVLMAQAKRIKNEIAKLDANFKSSELVYKKLLYALPNVPTKDTPIGHDETANKVLRKEGTISTFSFEPKNHWEIGKELDIIDTERAAKISGARFAYLKKDIVLLEFAIISFVLSIVTDTKQLTKIFKKAKINISAKPFIPILPPVFIRSAVFEQMGRLEPREDKYEFANDDQFLIGSAEHTLGPLHMNETIDENILPIRYIGFSTCFRREAGTYGKDIKGLIRMHQFDKLEMESFTTKESGLHEQLALVTIQEHILSALKLPYQVVSICTGDMGKPDAKQIDIEVWMPGQKKYRETHSADYMSDFQSRRLNTYVNRKTGRELVHMNDATGVAFSRTLAAIIENYQTEKGSVLIPNVLRPFMYRKKEITRD